MPKKTNKEFNNWLMKTVREWAKTEDGKHAMKMKKDVAMAGLLKWLYMSGKIK